VTGRDYQVTLEPAGTAFSVRPGETVLNAALRQGHNLRYGCRHGNCSTCKYLLLEGTVDFGVASPYSLSETEREQGWALVCCAQPLEDVVIEDELATDDKALPMLAPQERLATVTGARPTGGVLWNLRVKLDQPLTFYAGQFVELGVAGRAGTWRSYSIASSPSHADELEFLIKKIPTGAFSGLLHEQMVGTSLSLRGPYGDGYLRDGANSVLLVAVGSGIAPVRSILRHAAESGDERSFVVIYGARDDSGLAVLKPLQELESRLNLAVKPTLTRPTAGGNWTGRVGRVIQVVQREVEDATDLDAYLCGMPAMCDSMGMLLDAKGIRGGAVHFDRFYPASGELSFIGGR
jgi:propane monooxygenase reductase component